MPNVTTKSTEVHGAPAFVAVGLAGSGTVFTDLGILPRVETQIVKFAQSQQNEIGQLMADSPVGAIQGGTTILTLLTANATKLAALFKALLVETAATSLGAIEDLTTVVPIAIHVRPRRGMALPAYFFGQWMPFCVGREIGAFIQKVEETQQASETYTISFDLHRGTEDATAVTPQVISAGGGIWFRGDSADYVTVGWEADLPAGYES